MSEPFDIARTADGRSVSFFPAMGNRHGLITGATGTGKTISLQVLADHFSQLGVPVFLADVKGDLSGVAAAGTLSAKLKERLAATGIAPPEADPAHRAQCRSTFVRNLRLAAREAAAQGVELTIEPINQRDMPGYFLTTQAEAHAIREEVGVENLKVQMDLYHAQIVEGDLSEKIRRWLPHIGHIQVAGVPGRHEPDVGEINYYALFALLDEVGYRGWVGCEYRPLHDTLRGLRWMERLV